MKTRKLFEEIQKQKSFYASSNDGAKFEEKFKNLLKSFGFSEIVQISKTKSAIEEIAQYQGIAKKNSTQLYSSVKKEILAKNSLEVVRNPYSKISNTFIFQPFGSQEFPDFILLTKKYIIPIEIKFSKNNKKQKNLNKFRPMWNSNLPKANAIYIFGVSGEDVTFFKGSDILSFEARQALLNYFENIDRNQGELDNILEKYENHFGLYPYLRRAYEHKASKVKGSKGHKIESYFSDNAKKRELKVLDLLGQLE